MVWELLSKQDFKAISFCFTILSSKSWKTCCRFYESIQCCYANVLKTDKFHLFVTIYRTFCRVWVSMDKQIYPSYFLVIFEQQRINKFIPSTFQLDLSTKGYTNLTLLFLAKFVHPILSLFSQKYFMEKNGIIPTLWKHL